MWSYREERWEIFPRIQHGKTSARSWVQERPNLITWEENITTFLHIWWCLRDLCNPWQIQTVDNTKRVPIIRILGLKKRTICRQTKWNQVQLWRFHYEKRKFHRVRHAMETPRFWETVECLDRNSGFHTWTIVSIPLLLFSFSFSLLVD